MAVLRTSDNMLVMYKHPFEDSDLSMGARGMLASLFATDKRIDEFYHGTNRTLIMELISKGYIYEDEEDGLRVYNVDAIPHKVKQKRVKSSAYINILHNALGGQMWDTNTFVVHHINHNRNDNRASNLILLPKRMHGRYHMLFNMVEGRIAGVIEKDLDLNIICHHDAISELIDIKVEMAIILQAHMEAIYNAKNRYSLGLSEYDGFAYVWNQCKHIYKKYI